MTVARRAALLVWMVLLVLGSLASPAAAHGRGSDATNYSSTITAAPDLEGVEFHTYGGDEYLGVTNTSDTEIVIEGYEREPYLRVGPDGVFENRQSPATYINAERYGTNQPEGVDPSSEPQWVRVGDGPTVLWHDHRIHWMSPQLAPAITDPTVATTVYEEWGVPFGVGEVDYEVVGTLRWVPGSSASPWLVGALLAVLPALAGLRSRPTSTDRWPGLARPAAAVLGVVGLLNLVHLIDDLVAVPLPWATRALSAGQTALFIAIALFGAVKAWQAREGAFTALGVGAGALLIGQGALYLGSGALTTSQTASVFPLELTRLVIALSAAQAIPLLLVAVIGTRRTLPPLEAEVAPDAASVMS